MNKEIIIPTEWADVTLGEFIELSKLNIDSFQNPIEYYVRMLIILGNEDTDGIFEFIKASDINNIIGQMSFMNTPPSKKGVKDVKINGKKYFLESNLNNLSVGEVVSIETLIEDKKVDSVGAIPIVLSVLLKPKGESFDSNLCEDRINLFKNNVSIEEALGMSVFFSTGER